jgi:hypothetical protein
MATGVLALCVGRATRLARFLTMADQAGIAADTIRSIQGDITKG